MRITEGDFCAFLQEKEDRKGFGRYFAISVEVLSICECEKLVRALVDHTGSGRVMAGSGAS